MKRLAMAKRQQEMGKPQNEKKESGNFTDGLRNHVVYLLELGYTFAVADLWK